MTGTAAAAARRRLDALCTPFAADVFRFVYWLCRDRTLTEDVVETLLRAWRSFESLSDEKAARHWLLTIARRELARTFERKRLPTVDIDTVEQLEDEALAAHERQEIEEMRRAISALDVAHREPLVLQVLLGYSTEEIAQHLDISVAAVLTRLYRARQALRSALGERVKITLSAELFNVFNSNTEMNRVNQFNASSYRQVDEILAPRIVRFGVRLTF